MALVLPKDHKECTVCKEIKPFTNFNTQKNGKFGLRGKCKVCFYAINKKYYVKSQKVYYAKHTEKIRSKAKAKYLEDPKKAIQATLKSRTKHYNKFLTYSKKYEAEHKEERLLKSRMYAKNNPHMVAKTSLKRRQKQKNATPIWSNIKMTARIYKLRDRLNRLSGYIKYHVDHVIPLNAKIASGLHVPENLKIELASVNMSKRNTYEGVI